MSSVSALYRSACDEEGCVPHSELIKLFYSVDTVLYLSTSTRDSRGTGPSSAPHATDGACAGGVTPSLRCSTHISLSHTHLGDAGAAAFFRVLPLLRWVRVVDARGIGAGPRSMAALATSLTAHRTARGEDGAAHGVKSTFDGRSSGSSGGGGGASLQSSPFASQSTAVRSGKVKAGKGELASRVPALELVDLRDNDAIFSLSVSELLTALRRRRAMLLQRWGSTGDGAAPDVDVVLPGLEVYVDERNLLPSTARALAAWNAEQAAVNVQRSTARAEQRWQEQLRLFTVPDDETEGTPNGGLQRAAVGEELRLRLPYEGGGDAADDDVQHVDAANAIRAAINAHMPTFLHAAVVLRPPPAMSQESTGEHYEDEEDDDVAANAAGARAALQVCVDFGADTLSVLASSTGAHTMGADAAQGTPAAPSSSPFAVRIKHAEARRSVATLLRALDASPTLEAELLASEAAGSDALRQHLQRLRVLFSTVHHTSDDLPPATEKDWAEMMALYYRVVAALVASPFSAQHIPSLSGCEADIVRVVAVIVGLCTSGSTGAALMSRLLRRVRQTYVWTGPFGEAATLSTEQHAEEEEQTEPAAASVEAGAHLLPTLMARYYDELQHSSGVEAAWAAVYAGNEPAFAGDGGVARHSSSRSRDTPRSRQSSHRCRCQSVPTLMPSPELLAVEAQAPCASCCYSALKAVEDALRDPATRATLCARWLRLAPARAALPRSLRCFGTDMVVRQRSRARGGCAFVPPLDGVADRAVGVRWSMLAWLACARHQEAYLTELLCVFAQWYRLRAVEAGGGAEAAQRLLC